MKFMLTHASVVNKNPTSTHSVTMHNIHNSEMHESFQHFNLPGIPQW